MCECADRLSQARHELEVQWGKGQLDMGKLRGLLTDPHEGDTFADRMARRSLEALEAKYPGST